MSGFYKVDNEILKFREDKDQDEILFNHYIIRKENYQRLKDDLPRGQFYITELTASTDLNITRWKLRGLIKKFLRLGIIERVFIPAKGSREPSIFQYNINAQNDAESEDKNAHDETHDEVANTNGLIGANAHDETHDETHDSAHLKKNKEKELLKTIYSQTLNHLNKKAGTNYRSTATASQRLIKARLKEGFVLEDLIKVIDIKSSEWMGTEYQKYLRPETLFGSKFEGYLNSGQASSSPGRKNIRVLNKE